MEYLTDLPTDICNEVGLSKTLLTRRETIRLKHLQKSLFIYKVISEEELDKRFKIMGFHGLFQYIEYLTNQLRGIYKYTREFQVDDVDKITKTNNCSSLDLMKLYRKANPLIVLDFDKTITKKKFHSIYRWMILEMNFNVVINSANPQLNVIENYLNKNDLPMPSKIYANRGKQAKIRQLKVLGIKYMSVPRFYIDDELEYLEYGSLLFYNCYIYDGKLKNRSLNIK